MKWKASNLCSAPESEGDLERQCGQRPTWELGLSTRGWREKGFALETESHWARGPGVDYFKLLTLLPVRKEAS